MSGRTFQVRVNEFLSSYYEMLSGVSQRSVFGSPRKYNNPKLDSSRNDTDLRSVSEQNEPDRNIGGKP